ncbi:PDZ domain-containing protein [Verrucomicrobiaceae bacterium 5K15]|uniref:PDZ domain-containing protein n=1 Tax=Oceaniferula flava TaxID=2800421 RepID=A0AAE2S9Q5_9BACT|nr:PDZ domain-containing protein [Oceaniferula flavus]MBK1853921.1 PDZ domain-containing protein [Oceaniferula flavus]MBM1135227.1 PDZ domain-containing protein [Oceaniferula flavus]
MKTNRNLSKCVQTLVGAASMAALLPVSALEKPADQDSKDAPKVKAGATIQPKAAKPAKKMAMLGVGGHQVSETLASHLGLADGEGLTIYHVIPDSAAAKAGVEVHDVVTALNDRKISSQDDLRAAILAHQPGDEVIVKLIHQGKASEKKIKLGERTEMPRIGRAVLPGGAMDLQKMLQGMGGNIPEGDRKRLEAEMLKQFKLFRGQLGMNGDVPFAPQKMLEGGVQIVGNASVTIQDDQGSVTLKTTNGKKEVIVRDKNGKTTFEGPYETEQDKAAVPDDISDRVKRVDMDFKGKGMRLRIDPGGFALPPAIDLDDVDE